MSAVDENPLVVALSQKVEVLECEVERLKEKARIAHEY